MTIPKSLRDKKQKQDLACVCTNVTGTIKLLPLFIGKSASYRPICFTHYKLNNLLVVYKSQKNACIIFSSFLLSRISCGTVAKSQKPFCFIVCLGHYSLKILVTKPLHFHSHKYKSCQLLINNYPSHRQIFWAI